MADQNKPRFTTDFPLEVCTLIANELEDCGHEHCLTVSCVSDPLNLTRLNKKLAQAAKPVLWTHVKTLEVFVHQLDSELYQGDGVNTPFTVTTIPITRSRVGKLIRFSRFIKTFYLEQSNINRVSPVLLDAISSALGSHRLISPKLQYLQLSTCSVPRFVREHLLGDKLQEILLPRCIPLDFLNGLNITQLNIQFPTCDPFDLPFPPPYALRLPHLKKLAFTGWDSDISAILFSYFKIRRLERLQITFRAKETIDYLDYPRTYIHGKRWLKKARKVMSLDIREFVSDRHRLPQHQCNGLPPPEIIRLYPNTKYRFETTRWFWCGCDDDEQCSQTPQDVTASPFPFHQLYWRKRFQPNDAVFKPHRECVAWGVVHTM